MTDRIMSIAVSGLEASQVRLRAVAANLAHAQTAGYRPLEARLSSLPGGGVAASLQPASSPAAPDTAEAMVALVETRLQFSANARAFETGATLWDLLQTIRRD
ncbi:flagellar basal body protein [Gellertiella hungarica]|uniref:Flagellar basal-body rod protein FlgC n=1 Tax=Gellertiella hungarica TaxID=1572859 RepID=A0A7W6NKI1_9HYPH|nr:flagellar basal body protein [Gellertiella hungarica]MBB4064327.1 flagellar basal-body rod protein FlgC [Gellertiella hungarica]